MKTNLKHIEQRLEKILFEIDDSIRELYSHKNDDISALTAVVLDMEKESKQQEVFPAIAILKYLEDLEHVLFIGKNIINGALKSLTNLNATLGGG